MPQRHYSFVFLWVLCVCVCVFGRCWWGCFSFLCKNHTTHYIIITLQSTSDGQTCRAATTVQHCVDCTPPQALLPTHRCSLQTTATTECLNTPLTQLQMQAGHTQPPPLPTNAKNMQSVSCSVTNTTRTQSVVQPKTLSNKDSCSENDITHVSHSCACQPQATNISQPLCGPAAAATTSDALRGENTPAGAASPAEGRAAAASACSPSSSSAALAAAAAVNDVPERVGE